MAVTKYGAVNYAKPDGTPAQVKGYGTYSYFPPEALMLAMTYMYEGQTRVRDGPGHKVWHNLVCRQGYTWDMPNIMRGDVDTGERTYGNDYYQDMILWSLPAALVGSDSASRPAPGGLVDRVVKRTATLTRLTTRGGQAARTPAPPPRGISRTLTISFKPRMKHGSNTDSGQLNSTRRTRRRPLLQEQPSEDEAFELDPCST